MNAQGSSGDRHERTLFKVLGNRGADTHKDLSKLFATEAFYPKADNRRSCGPGSLEESMEVGIESNNRTPLSGGIRDDPHIGGSGKTDLANMDNVPPRVPESDCRRSR